MKQLMRVPLFISIFLLIACGDNKISNKESFEEAERPDSSSISGDAIEIARPNESNASFPPLVSFSVKMNKDWSNPNNTNLTLYDADGKKVYQIWPGDNFSSYEVIGRRIYVSMKNKDVVNDNLRLYCIDTSIGLLEDTKIDVGESFIVDEARGCVYFVYAKKYSDLPGYPGYSTSLNIVKIYSYRSSEVYEYDKNLELPYLPTGVYITLNGNYLLIAYHADSSIPFKSAQVNLETKEFSWLE